MPIIWTTLYFAPWTIPSCPAYEPNSNDGEYSVLFRHIQYNRIASLRPIANLAMLLCRRTARWWYLRRQSGCTRAAAWGRLHQQQAQQRTALLTDVTQSLFATTGFLTRDHSHVRADLLAALKPRRSSDDQHVGECRNRTDTGVSHQPRRLRSLPGFPIDGCG